MKHTKLKQDNQNMMNTQNKISGEVNTLSLVVRKYIARYCVTIASHVPARLVNLSKDEQAQNNKTHLSLKGVTNK